MIVLRTRTDLQRLIDDRWREGLTLEYKASPALNRTNDGRAELIKDVSALANSAGGQIIYGIVERNGVPIELDEGVDPVQMSAETISGILSSLTSPRIPGIEINFVDAGSGRVFVVLTVPQSKVLSPHQNTIDHKYYKRSESRAIPMMDYEIRDIMNRNMTPRLEVACELGAENLMDPSFNIDSEPRFIHLRMKVFNRSTSPAMHTPIILDADINAPLVQSRYSTEIWKPLGNVAEDGHSYTRFMLTMSSPDHLPIFKELPLEVPDAHLRLNNTYYGSALCRAWLRVGIYTPGWAQLQTGYVEVRDRALELVLSDTPVDQ